MDTTTSTASTTNKIIFTKTCYSVLQKVVGWNQEDTAIIFQYKPSRLWNLQKQESWGISWHTQERNTLSKWSIKNGWSRNPNNILPFPSFRGSQNLEKLRAAWKTKNKKSTNADQSRPIPIYKCVLVIYGVKIANYEWLHFNNEY